MLTLAQVQPVAYMGDGFIVCLKCGDKAGLPVKDQLVAYNLESDFEEDGVTCDDCGKVLVEPYRETEYCAEHGEVEVNPNDARCPICEHATSTTEEEAKRFAQQCEDEDASVPLQGVCKDCGNGTLNNTLVPAFDDAGDRCLRCGGSHLDLL